MMEGRIEENLEKQNKEKAVKCAVWGCDNEAVGRIRTKMVCEKHFQQIKRDNLRRLKKGIKIESKLDLLPEDEINRGRKGVALI